MTDLPQITSVPTRSRSSKQGGSARRTRLNQVIAWPIVILLVLAPLPFGSVRAVFWGIAAVVVGLVAVYYAYGMIVAGKPLRVSLGVVGLPALLMGAFCIYLVVQVLPLDWLLGDLTVVSTHGTTINPGQISIAPDVTLLMLLRQVTFGILFFLVLQIAANDGRRMVILDVLLVAIVVYAVYGMVSLQAGDTILGLQKWAYLGSATGPFVNRNSFATFLAFGTVIAGAKIVSQLARQRARHSDDGRVSGVRSNLILYGIALVSLLAVLVSTQSRMGLASAMFGMLVVGIVGLRYLYGSRVLWLLIPAAVLLGAVVVAFGNGLFERLGNVDSSAGVRFDLYQQVVELISLRPLTGFGGGTFALAFPLVHEQPVSIDMVWSRAHNSYLALWSEAGLVFGSLPILALALLGLKMASDVRKQRGDWKTQAMSLGILTVGAVHSLADFSLEITANSLLFTALLAIGMASTAPTDRDGVV